MPNQPSPDSFRTQNFKVQLLRQFDPNTYLTTRIDHRFSEKHFVTGNLIYELPFAKSSHGIKRVLLQGWEWESVYSFFSGEYMTPTWTGPDPTGTAFTSSRTAANITLRPDQLRNGNLPVDQRTNSRFFDVSAFDAPAAGRFGTSAKGVLKGPGSAILNVGIAKRFNLAERLRLVWDLTATNFFNSTNYTNPVTNITSRGSVGVLTGAGGEQDLDAAGSRGFRTGLRLEW